jgi:hypothetical protein
MIFLAGILLWLGYGLIKGDIAIITAKAIMTVLIGLMLRVKARSGLRVQAPGMT